MTLKVEEMKSGYQERFDREVEEIAQHYERIAEDIRREGAKEPRAFGTTAARTNNVTQILHAIEWGTANAAMPLQRLMDSAACLDQMTMLDKAGVEDYPLGD